MIRSLESVSTGKFDVSPLQVRVAQAKAAFTPRPNIMPHPTDPNRILRTVTLDPARDPETQIAIAETHWQHLGGVAVPQTAFATREGRNGKVTGLAIVDKIAGRDVSEIINDEHRSAEELAAVRGLAKAIDEYHNWVNETEQTHVLADMTGMRQYRYGHPESQQGAPNQIYAVDRDPIIADTATYRQPGGELENQGQQTWDGQLTDFASWAETHPVDVPVTAPYRPYGAPDPFA